MVPKRGLEPPRGCPHMVLNHARLPISPLRQVEKQKLSAGLAVVKPVSFAKIGWFMAKMESWYQARVDRRAKPQSPARLRDNGPL